VVKDPPSNTNISFDAIFNFVQIEQMKSWVERSPEQIWTFATLQGYVKFHPQTDIKGLAEQLRDFPSRLDANANRELLLMPASDVRHRLNTDVPFTLNFIRLFVAAGILLLFSALFNFLNLNLDLFHQRIRELRQRAVHGAKSMQLIMQMMFELTCSIFLALTLAGFLVILTNPLFSGLLGITMGVSQLIYLFVVCGTGIMALILIVGFIPFWRLSRLAMCYLSKIKSSGQPVWRRMAVTLQLAVSVVFIIAALVVMMQMRFVNHKDLGFDSNGIIRLSGASWFTNDNVRTVLLHELASIPQIESVTDTYFEPQHNAKAFNSEINTMTTNVEWSGKLQSENPVFQIIVTDSRFIETFRTKMVMGKWLDETGDNKIVLNEEAVRVMGLDEPVGAIIRMSSKDYVIAGVVNDFHTMSLRSRIQPTLFRLSPYQSNSLYIRAVQGQEKEAMRRITEILSEIDVSLVEIHPTPLKELYARLNYSEQAGLQLFSVLASVCLLISLFGIYAVATASTLRRRKEIAIRKVFGAQVGDIVRMFFREYTLQVIIAGVIALPLAYYAMHRWLEGYAYRTNIPWWLLAGVLTIIIAVVLCTVLGQVLKAANSNPAEVVKSE
jgi:putative ABC transport system permease protein